jgi:flagellar biogenesis protein FliO
VIGCIARHGVARRPALGQSVLSAFILLLVTSPLHAASLLSTNVPPLTPLPLPAGSFSVFRVFGALVLVLALFLAGVWVYRNWHRVIAQRGRPHHLQILESRSLGGRHALHVVGYQAQRILLASSPNGVSLLTHLHVDETGVELNAGAGSAPSSPTPTDPQTFVRVLQQAVQRKA